jgi:hypothetical protein
LALSQDELELIRQAVTETLTTMGIDATQPIEVQKDMAHLRGSRRGSEMTQNLVKKTAVPIIVVGVIAAVWGGFSDAITELLGKRG